MQIKLVVVVVVVVKFLKGNTISKTSLVILLAQEEVEKAWGQFVVRQIFRSFTRVPDTDDVEHSLVSGTESKCHISLFQHLHFLK